MSTDALPVILETSIEMSVWGCLNEWAWTTSKSPLMISRANPGQTLPNSPRLNMLSNRDTRKPSTTELRSRTSFFLVLAHVNTSTSWPRWTSWCDRLRTCLSTPPSTGRK